MKLELGIFVPLILVAACVAVAGYLFTRPAPWQAATPALQLADVPKVPLQIKVPLQVYPPAAKQKLRLPPAVQQDPNKSVIAATEIKPSSRRQTVTVLIDATTGQPEILTLHEPHPWMATSASGAIGLERDFLRKVNTLYVRRDFLQAKSVYLSGSLSAASDKELSAKATIEWRW